MLAAHHVNENERRLGVGAYFRRHRGDDRRMTPSKQASRSASARLAQNKPRAPSFSTPWPEAAASRNCTGKDVRASLPSYQEAP